MTVYLEYAILDNFIMDFLLLFCAAVTLKIPFKKRRIALGAAVGTAIALCSVNLQGFWAYCAKALCLFLMCVCAVGFGKKLFWFVFLTLAYTFITGGAIVGVFHLFNVPFQTENGLCYNMPVPLFVYLLGVSFAAFLCYCLAQFVKQTKAVAPHLKKVQVTLQKTYVVTGFCDSGNTVSCNGLPVCFVTKKFGNVSQYFAQEMLRGNYSQVEISTLTGTQKVVAVQANLRVDGISYAVYLALPAQKCKTHYELLLSCEFCNSLSANEGQRLE